MTVRRALSAALLGCALVAAQAQTMPAPPPAEAGCVVRDHVPPAELGGEWRVQFSPGDGAFDAPGEQGLLRLERHPEYAGSVRGQLVRDTGASARTSLVSGDVVDGEFHLDESDDGQRMSATWAGVALDCAGRLKIRGTRQPAQAAVAPEPARRFQLERQPGWR